MEQKEFTFKGLTLNGFLMIFVTLLCFALSFYVGYLGFVQENWLIGLAFLMLLFSITILAGFIMLEPNEARVMTFFGNYRGTFSRAGLYWVNPFISAKRLSLRARNLDAQPIKVNDKSGNPIMIGMVLVWKLKDTYKAMFEIDAQTMAQSADGLGTNRMKSIMDAFEQFVRIQSDAALRQVAGQYSYDTNEGEDDSITLREGGDIINKQLKEKLDERLDLAGIEVEEARINYLAYAPEIAAIMLRRQQASAIISAREKIVEGAVSMVKMALQKLSEEEIVELDEEKKAAMVSNLLVVLCGDDAAQPVVNTGTLNM